jgi:hypothetical protein
MTLSSAQVGGNWASHEHLVDYMNDSIEAIVAWLRVQCKTPHVTAHADMHRDVIVFRLDLGDGALPRHLEIGENALRDVPPEDILIDLGRAAVTDRLRQDPTMRLQYTNERSVPHLETLLVRYENEEYRIVRDAAHTVRIFDASDRPLPNTPRSTTLQSSIFARPIDKWIDDIRNWRCPAEA